MKLVYYMNYNGKQVLLYGDLADLGHTIEPERVVWTTLLEYLNYVSMSEYGLDCQSRHSKSCVVNDGSLSTEVLRVTVGYRGTRSKTFRFMFRSKELREEAADGRAKDQGRVHPCPLLPAV